MPASTVGTSAVQLPNQDVNEVIIIKAASANTDKVYVLNNSGVTANSADATDGIQLSAGESIAISPFMAGRNANTIYVIGGAALQKIFYWIR